MSMNPLSVSLPMLSAFINQTFEGCSVLCCKFWKKKKKISNNKKLKNERCYSIRRDNNKSNSLRLAVFLACIHLHHCLSTIPSLFFSNFHFCSHLLPSCGSWRASFVIQQVMSAMFFTLTSTPPLMRYHLCCFMFAQPRLRPGSNNILKPFSVTLSFLSY